MPIDVVSVIPQPSKTGTPAAKKNSRISGAIGAAPGHGEVDAAAEDAAHEGEHLAVDAIELGLLVGRHRPRPGGPASPRAMASAAACSPPAGTIDIATA